MELNTYYKDMHEKKEGLFILHYVVSSGSYEPMSSVFCLLSSVSFHCFICG